MLSGLMPQPPYPWLRGTWQNFAGLVEHKRIPHALLLIGQDGIGCEDLAKAMAQLLLCHAPVEGHTCGRCRSCLLAKADGHPDLYVVEPEENSSAIKINQIREMTHFVANTSQQGGRKVIVIHPAEAMNNNAANALLKNLEEPNGDCVFILIAQKAAFLMPTIRSRCARTVIQVPPEEQALDWLERNQVDNSKLLLDEAGGRPLQVMEWLEQDIWERKRELEQQLINLLAYKTTFTTSAKQLQSYELNWVIEQMLGWLMKAVPQALTESSMSGAEASAERIVVELSHCSVDRLIDLYDVLLTKKRQLASGANPNGQLALEDIMMKFKGLKTYSS